MSVAVDRPRIAEISRFTREELELANTFAQDRKGLLSEVEARTVKPRPLRQLSFQELRREEEIIPVLLLAIAHANAAKVREILDAEAEDCLLEAITGESRVLSEAPPRRYPEDACVVSSRLESILRLRLQLCRSELSRRKATRR